MIGVLFLCVNYCCIVTMLAEQYTYTEISYYFATACFYAIVVVQTVFAYQRKWQHVKFEQNAVFCVSFVSASFICANESS